MNYCEHCCIIIEDAHRCPQCGGHHVRPMREDDLCFVTETGYLWAGVFEDMLQQSGIRYVKRSSIGAALATAVGSLLDRTGFYVRYPDLDAAKTLAGELFAPDDGGEDAPDA